MKTAHQERIEEFMRLAGQELPATPCIPSEEVRLLRARLILEEALETIDALGVVLRAPSAACSYNDGVTLDDFEFDPYLIVNGKEVAKEPNLVEIADGCADISVVTIGTLSACGIADYDLLRVVDDSNLAKFTGDAHHRDDGKWIKPSDWKPPDIVGVLNMQTYDPGKAPSRDVFHPLEAKADD